MTTPWKVLTIEADNYFAVVNMDNVVTPAGKTCRIWDSSKNWDDNLGGSVQPIVFYNDMDITITSAVPMKLVGTAKFPSGWAGGKYALVGALDGKPIVESVATPVPIDGSVIIDGFWLLCPDTEVRQVSVPFKNAGAFHWTIYFLKDDKREQPMHASTPTLLELCWSRGAPPKGPISPPNPTTPTRADFTIGYPIHLFRMFAPPATELFQSSSSPDEDVRYYVDRAVGSVVWNPASDRIQYDVYVGKSYFGVYSLGGNFASAAWFRALRPKCNCYDVAGISQLAMTMLVDDNGVEMGDSHWVFQVPNGFINPGPLIGWVKAGGLNLECNSPFWGHAGTAPKVDADSDRRTYFGNHAFVEINVQAPGSTPTVLDACHALEGTPPEPAVGTLSRVLYLNDTLDSTRTPRGNGMDNMPAIPSGNCYLNPVTQQYRIGVFGPWGYPGYLTGDGILDRIPQDRKREIEGLIPRGRAPTDEDPTFNTVHVADAIRASAEGQSLEYHPNRSTLEVFPGATLLAHNFMTASSSGSREIIVQVDAFDAIDSPAKALTYFLAGYSAATLEGVVEPWNLTPHLGQYAFRDATSIFWIRGNLFIRVLGFTAPDSDGSDLESVAGDIQALAAAVDQEFRERESVPDMPETIEVRDAPEGVQRGPRLTEVHLRVENAGLFEVLASESDNNNVLVSRGPPEDDMFTFYAMKSGKATVTIVGSAKGSLKPVQLSLEIEVEIEG